MKRFIAPGIIIGGFLFAFSADANFSLTDASTWFEETLIPSSTTSYEKKDTNLPILDSTLSVGTDVIEAYGALGKTSVITYGNVSEGIESWGLQAAVAGTSFGDVLGDILYDGYLNLKQFFGFGEDEDVQIPVLTPVVLPSMPVPADPQSGSTTTITVSESYVNYLLSDDTQDVQSVSKPVQERAVNTNTVTETVYIPARSQPVVEPENSKTQETLRDLLFLVRDKIIPSLDDSTTTIVRSGGGSRSSFPSVANDRFLRVNGGTLTGAMTGTSATFSETVSASALSAATLSVTGSTTFNGVEYLFPDADGSADYVLRTNGNGGLSWANVSSITPAGDWRYFNDSGVRLATTTNQVLIGGSATSSLQALEVIGGAFFSGNVGIGTTTPQADFAVQGDTLVSGSGTFENGLTVKTGGATITGDLTVNGNTFITSGGVLNVGDKIIAPGEIGVGTSTPAAKLAIQSTNPAMRSFLIYGTSTQSAPLLDIFDNQISNTNLLRVAANGDVTAVGNISAASLTASGNTASVFAYASTTALSVSGQAYFNSTTTFNGVPYLFPGADGSNGEVLVTNGSGGLSWGQGSQWSNTGSDIYYTGGNVGIGTSSPSQKLSVHGDTLISGNLQVATITATSSNATSTFSGGAVFATGGGNVGIGTLTPTTKLDVNGQVRANLGSKTAPSYIFSNDSDTGMYSPAANQLAFSVGGSTRMRVAATGVAIDASADDHVPAAELHVVGSAKIILQNAASSNGTFFFESTASGSDNTFKIGEGSDAFISVIGDSPGAGLTRGNVGIGTTSPYAKLSVAGEAVAEKFTGTLTSATSTFNGNVVVNKRLTVTESTGNQIQLGHTAIRYNILSVTGVNDDFSIYASGAASNVLTLTNYGTLTVRNSFKANGTGDSNNDFNGTLNIHAADTTKDIKDILFISHRDIIAGGAGQGAGILIQGNDSGGNTDSLARVSGLWIDATTGSEDSAITFDTRAAGGSLLEAMRIDNNRNVGIGTTSPWRTLSVSGTAAFSGLTAATVSESALCITAAGEVVVNTGTQTCTVSSERFKHDIDDLKVGDMIAQFRPVTYRENGSNQERIGLIAEEVAKIDPRLVSREKDGRPRSVRYEEIVPILIKGVQELSDKVGTQIGSKVNSFAATIGRFGELFAERLTIGTSDAPAGITLYDEVTGEPYCLSIRSGKQVTQKGTCEEPAPDHVPLSDDNTPPAPIELETPTSTDSGSEIGGATTTAPEVTTFIDIPATLPTNQEDVSVEMIMETATATPTQETFSGNDEQEIMIQGEVSETSIESN